VFDVIKLDPRIYPLARNAILLMHRLVEPGNGKTGLNRRSAMDLDAVE